MKSKTAKADVEDTIEESMTAVDVLFIYRSSTNAPIDNKLWIADYRIHGDGKLVTPAENREVSGPYNKLIRFVPLTGQLMVCKFRLCKSG